MRDILFYANFSTLVFLQLLVWQSNRAPKIDPTEGQKFDWFPKSFSIGLCLHRNNHVTLPQQTRTCMRLTVKSEVMIFDLDASTVEERRRGEGRSSPSVLVRLHIVAVNVDSIAVSVFVNIG